MILLKLDENFQASLVSTLEMIGRCAMAEGGWLNSLRPMTHICFSKLDHYNLFAHAMVFRLFERKCVPNGAYGLLDP